MKPLPRNAALLLSDVRAGFDEPSWSKRNNPVRTANLQPSSTQKRFSTIWNNL